MECFSFPETPIKYLTAVITLVKRDVKLHKVRLHFVTAEYTHFPIWVEEFCVSKFAKDL